MTSDNLTAAQSNGQHIRSPIKALVVDDSTTACRLIDLTLRSFGIDLDFTDNGEEAVALAKKKRYDIIFLDILLPGIDGYRVCRTIKADRRTKETPVVMLTSKTSAIDKVRGIMAGTDIYLTKPIDRGELIQAVHKCLPEKLSQTSGARRTDVP